LPFWSVAEQLMLVTSLVAKFPNCRQTPSERSTDGIGRPSLHAPG
jgi:hypothetical protein